LQKSDLKLLGLIGNPVSHSRSPEIFQRFFNQENKIVWVYQLFHLSKITDLENLLLQHPNLIGFNVTVPFKESIIPLLNSIGEGAEKVKAVNTVLITREGNKTKLHGENTDILGFENLIDKLTVPLNCKCLILGSGGSSKAVQYVLHKKNIPFQIVSRKNSSISYNDLNAEIINNHKIIINTTPLGMTPHRNEFPQIPYEFIGQNHICIDLIYNPEKTLFLELAEKKGAFIQNGLPMLQAQAEKAWELFKLNI